MLEKTYRPGEVESRIYETWERSGAFAADPERNARRFVVMIPPPNVTGSLHIGHALNDTMQDVLVRYNRMRGRDVLWQPGMDHAGIATQMVVERQLAEQGISRRDLGREAFVEKVWEWKAESGGTILRQLRRLGASADWARERFTMDEGLSLAVRTVFVQLYKEGLIYKDQRLVNWDPKLQTAISDLEVQQRETKGSLWHFRYPVEGEEGRFIVVATTRPETMLGDTAVAVHPEDERYEALIGRDVVLPLVGRRIPIVGDHYSDPEKGSGAVKITPAHDFNDFEVGKRAGIAPADMLNMLDGDANVCQTADGLVPEEFLGLHRFKQDGVDGARELVVARLKEQGFLIPHVAKTKKGEEVEHDAEPRQIATPFGDRGGVVIEPWLTDQWYVDAAKLAEKPISQVRDGTVEIVPKSWEKTFFNWMENIQPWCVSRQLWWGHRIPAWFDADGNVFVAQTEEEAQAQAGEGVELTRDPDVLDTWFSSVLWPFATLGWPEDGQPLLEKHFPNSLLISGFDILFFWDARMMMMGNYNMGEAPWPRLYLHGLVRAADGSKMSKSKGNVVDPLGLIDQYGADALRFFMAAMESQGRDIKMDEKRVEGYRNFATKLWNATRFCQSNGIGASTTLKAPTARLAANQWIIGEVQACLGEIDAAMADLRFDAAANAIYQFTWSKFCDWYLELIKPELSINPESNLSKSEQEQRADETRLVAGWVLDQIFVMLHPFMPFITEELWHAQGSREYDLIVAKWPNPRAPLEADAMRAINWVIDLIKGVRSSRNDLNVPASKEIDWTITQFNDWTIEAYFNNQQAIRRLARIGRTYVYKATQGLTISPGGMNKLFAHFKERELAAGAKMQVVAEGFLAFADLEGIIDIDSEKARLTKALEASQKEAKSLEGRLSNANFVERAKPEAVEKAKADFAHHTGEVERLTAALARLG